MKSDHFFKIIAKYLSGKASPEEVSFLRAYYNLFEWENDGISTLSAEEKQLLRVTIKDQLIRVIAPVPAAGIKRKLIRRWSIAASLLLLSTVGITLFLHKSKGTLITYDGKRAHIKSGGNGAILLLSNGDRVHLASAAKGQIATAGLARIIKTANGDIIYHAGRSKGVDTALNTIYTPKGGSIMVVLPDGSKAYLNAESSLRFPSTFADETRKVSLTGEVYFEVTTNKSKPFMVNGGNQTVQVLGTHFVVNAYNDEHMVRTTLLEGRVTVVTNGHRSFLKPGEQAVNNNGNLNVRPLLNAEETIAWKNGLFHFEKAGIRDVLREFSRWYDVQIIYTGTINERLFSGDIYKNLRLEDALQVLNYEDVHFTIKGRQIFVNPQ